MHIVRKVVISKEEQSPKKLEDFNKAKYKLRVTSQPHNGLIMQNNDMSKGIRLRSHLIQYDKKSIHFTSG